MTGWTISEINALTLDQIELLFDGWNEKSSSSTPADQTLNMNDVSQVKQMQKLLQGIS